VLNERALDSIDEALKDAGVAALHVPSHSDGLCQLEQ
jgi:hypothetical protein